MSTSKKNTNGRYSPEQKEHAVRLVRLRRDETGEKHGSVTTVAKQLGFGPESVRQWVRDADQADGPIGKNGASAPADAARISDLWLAARRQGLV